MHSPHSICTSHTVHVQSTQYMYSPCRACTLHVQSRVCVQSTQCMHSPHSICTAHTVHVQSTQYMYSPHSTCTVHAVAVQSNNMSNNTIPYPTLPPPLPPPPPHTHTHTHTLHLFERILHQMDMCSRNMWILTDGCRLHEWKWICYKQRTQSITPRNVNAWVSMPATKAGCMLFESTSHN